MACPEHPCRRHMGWGGEVLKVECDVPRCAACAECVKTQPAVGCGDQGLHACSESDAKRAKLSLRGEGPRPPPPPPPVAPSPPPSASPSCSPSPDVPAPARPPIDPDFEAWARGVLQQKQSIAARAEEDDSQPPPPQLVLPAGGTRGGAWLLSEPRRTLRPPASPDFAAPRGEETFPPPHVAVGASTLALMVLALVIRLRRHAAAEGAQVATTDDRRTLCEVASPQRRGDPKSSLRDSAQVAKSKRGRGRDCQATDRIQMGIMAKRNKDTTGERSKKNRDTQSRYGFAPSKRYASLRTSSPPRSRN